MAKKNDHWYARNVGDYMRKTQDLSMLQHGAYTLLLDYYYSTSQPLTAIASSLQRICRAFADDEVSALQFVLHRFFVLDGDVWRHERADFELLKRSKISKERSKAALAKHSQSDAIASVLHTRLHDTDTDTVKKATSVASGDALGRFFEFWERWVPYDMQKGSRKLAHKFYINALKQGVDHETLIRTSAQYLTNCRSNDNRSKHASTWLNQHGWQDDDALGAITPERSGGRPGGLKAGQPTAGELIMADRTFR